MSTAAAADAGAPKKGNKKLVIIAAAVVLLLVAGGGAFMMMKKKADPDAEGAGESSQPAAKSAARHDPKNPPVFVPLDSFTVNLADREAERYAQVGITLEVVDAAVGEQLKVYMPAVRNNILMALADKSARELMDREGKARLAGRIQRETSRALGYDVEEPDDEEAEAEEEDPPKKKKKKKKAVEPALPVTAVHFSNFIIQ